MNDRKLPPDDRNDELFDRDPITDSDSDFLAELDRVLAGQTQSQAESAGIAESAQEPAGSKRQADSRPGDSEDAVQEHEAALSSMDDYLPESAGDPAEDEYADEFRELGAELPEIKDRVTQSGIEQPDLEEDVYLSDRDAAAPNGARSPGSLLDLDLGDGPVPLPEPTARRSIPREASELLQEEEPVRASLLESVPAAALSATAPAPAAGPPPSTGSGSSAIWTGVAALLGLLGIAAGGAGLWQTQATDHRLARLETAPQAAPAEPAETSGTEQRIRELEQGFRRELQRLGADLALVGAEVARQPEIRAEDLGEDLEALKGDMTSLRDLIGEIQERVEKTETLLASAAARPLPSVPAQPAAPEAKGVDAAQVAVAPAKEPQPEFTGPRWSVNLLSFKRRERAESELKRLQDKGIMAEIRSVENGGATWQRIGVGGFTQFDEAKSYANEVRAKPGLSSAWISRD